MIMYVLMNFYNKNNKIYNKNINLYNNLLIYLYKILNIMKNKQK